MADTPKRRGTMMKALQKGRLDEIRKLVDSKSAMAERAGHNQTPLHVAAQMEGRADALMILLNSKKLDLNERDEMGWTALHCAAEKALWVNCEILLKSRAVDVRATNLDGNPPLLYLVKYAPRNQVEPREQFEKVARILLERGADINYQNRHGETPLYYAVVTDQLENSAFLLRSGANPNLQNLAGETPLHFAVRERNARLVMLLLNNGADTTLRNGQGKTAMDLAENDENMTKLLSDVNRADVITRQRMEGLSELETTISVRGSELRELMQQVKEARKELEERQEELSRLHEHATSKKQAIMRSKHKGVRLNFADVRVTNRFTDDMFYTTVSGWGCLIHYTDFATVAEAEAVLPKLAFLDELNARGQSIARYLHHDCDNKSLRVFCTVYDSTLQNELVKWKDSREFLDADEIKRLGQMIAEGTSFLHKGNILHRALDPERILVTLNPSGDVLALFLSCSSLAKKDDQWPIPRSGPQRYAAPEVVSSSAQVFATQSDVFSFGMILYTLLTLKFPFEEETDATKIHNLIYKCKRPKLPAALLSRASPETVDTPKRPASTIIKFDSEENVKISDERTPSTSSLNARHYRNLIDLFEVCTHRVPAMRPPIDTVLRALQEEESIKMWWKPPQEDATILMEKWLEVPNSALQSLSFQGRTPPDDVIVHCPAGFVFENPVAQAEEGTEEDHQDSQIMFQDRSVYYYKRYIVGERHDNYISLPSSPDSDDFAILTIEGTPLQVDGKSSYRAIIRTVREDIRVIVSCDSGKDRLKALKAHPACYKFRSNLVHVKDDKFPKVLEKLEADLAEPRQYKFGVIYRKKGQNSDDEMLSNRFSSKELTEFLEFLGDKIRLKGWNRFRGGLDISKNTTGTHAFYTTLLVDETEFEMVFHVSTMLPYMDDNPQQLARKRHIGNDVVVLIFQDEDADPFTPENIASHFNHVFFVVQPCTVGGTVKYKFNVLYKSTIQSKAFPALADPPLYDRDEKFRNVILSKMINAERVAMKSESFARRLSQTRIAVISDCIKTFNTKKSKR